MHHLAVGRGDGVGAALDGHCASGQAQGEAGSLEEAGFHQRQIFGRLAGEKFREMNPVVGRARLLAEHRDFNIGEAELVELLEELVAHHAMANHCNFHFVSCTHPPP